MLRVACLSIGLLLVLIRPAFGWAELGHQLVGERAERLLSPPARKEVGALLRGEPHPTLAGVAYWADALRYSDPERFRATSRWHYVSLAAGTCTYEAASACADGACVVEAIRSQVAVLADRSRSRDEQRDALKFLVHFVGDAHQPLHASDRPDKGGNEFQLSLRTDIPPEAYARDQFRDGVMGTNLHAVWDYYVLASAGWRLDEYAQRFPKLPPPDNASSLEPGDWASESCRAIDGLELYPDRHSMDHDYLDAMRPLAETRVAIAGRRLAQLLNEIFAAPDPGRTSGTP